MSLLDFPIVDAHQHLYDLAKVTLLWHRNAGFEKIARNHLLPEYGAAARGMPVVQTIYVEVDALPEQQSDDAEWILGLASQPENRVAGAVIGARIDDDHLPAHVERYKSHPKLKGVRDLLDEERSPPGRCLQPAFQGAMQRLGELNLCFDIAIRPAELCDAARLAAACPDTRFVLDHCGGAQIRDFDLIAWRQGLDRVAAAPNVACKISGLCSSPSLGRWSAEEIAPVVNACWDAFGPDRVLFGSDWPVCTLGGSLRRWVEALDDVLRERPASQRRGYFHDNAIRWYRL